MPKPIALLSDFGQKDIFSGVLKGAILSINPQVKIIDITHNIFKHNIGEAGFSLLHSYGYFPKKTIFCVVVDPGVGSRRLPIVVKTKNYYFIGPDNGVLSLAAKADGIDSVRVLENKAYFLKKVSLTFHGRDIFAPASAHLSKGARFSSLGRAIDKIKEISMPKPKKTSNYLEGRIIYSDHFGNLITNIKKNQLKNFCPNKFKASLRGKKIRGFSSSYGRADSEPFFIEGSFGYLEISLKNTSAKEYFKIKDIKNIKVIIKKDNG